MVTNNEYRKEDNQEYLIESNCVVEDQGKYIRIDWYAEDPRPADFGFDTEYGYCPKHTEMLGGVINIRTDFSMISKS